MGAWQAWLVQMGHNSSGYVFVFLPTIQHLYPFIASIVGGGEGGIIMFKIAISVYVIYARSCLLQQVCVFGDSDATF